MKAEVNEQDVVKHWGIYNIESERWLTSEDGIIFAVTCPRVANAQYDIMVGELEDDTDVNEDDWKIIEVREIK